MQPVRFRERAFCLSGTLHDPMFNEPCEADRGSSVCADQAGWILRSGIDQFTFRTAPIVGASASEYVMTMKDIASGLSGRAVRRELARVAVGRMFLHVACAFRDGRVQWHWEGIKRELPGCGAIQQARSELEKN